MKRHLRQQDALLKAREVQERPGPSSLDDESATDGASAREAVSYGEAGLEARCRGPWQRFAR